MILAYRRKHKLCKSIPDCRRVANEDKDATVVMTHLKENENMTSIQDDLRQRNCLTIDL